MDANPFLPLSFIVGPAILTNGCAVLLNGASIRYNLAIGLWRDLQAELHSAHPALVTPYSDRAMALELANRRVVLLLWAINLLYLAVGGFGVSALTGLTGAILSETKPGAWVEAAKDVTVAAGVIGLFCLLSAAVFFILESRCTFGLLRISLPPRSYREVEDQALD